MVLLDVLSLYCRPVPPKRDTDDFLIVVVAPLLSILSYTLKEGDQVALATDAFPGAVRSSPLRKGSVPHSGLAGRRRETLGFPRGAPSGAFPLGARQSRIAG